jgi:diguanylate cyclase (GGDEF)-like protein
MKGAVRPTIRARLVMLVLACIIPPSISAVAWVAYNYDQAKKQQATESIARARAMVSALDRELAGIHGALATLATSPYLTKGDLPAFYRQAQEVEHALGVINIILIDSAFQQRVNTIRPLDSPLPMESSPPTRAVFQRGLPVTTDLFLAPIMKQHIVAVAVPVIRRDKVLYALGATLDPERLSGILSKQRLAPGWIGAIIDSTGTVVVRSSQTGTGTGTFVGTRESPSLIRRVAEAPEGYLETDTLEGVPVLSAYSRSAASNWAVVLEMPSEDLARELWRSLRWLLAAIVLLFSVSLALAWGISNTIARAISELTRFATLIGEGRKISALPRLGLREAQEVGRALMIASEKLLTAEHNAHHDPLTGLANRRLFHEFVDRQLALCRRNGTSLAVLFIDLDGFKSVNDLHGHEIGDQLLCSVASRLASSIRGSDVAARLGGDEFAVLLVDPDIDRAPNLARKILDVISAPYEIQERALHISASAGVAAFPGCGDSSEQLLKRADEAMYDAKSNGKNGYAVALAR